MTLLTYADAYLSKSICMIRNINKTPISIAITARTAITAVQFCLLLYTCLRSVEQNKKQ